MTTQFDKKLRHRSTITRRRLQRLVFSWLGSSAPIAFSLALASTALSATELLNEPLRDGALPAGWAQTDVSFQTTASGYARFDAPTATLTTPSVDASTFDAVSLGLSVAKFGTGGDGPITIEYSLNGGTDWTTFGDTSVPTSSTYINDVFTINVTSSDMRLRFSRADSPSQKRLRDIVVTGVTLSGPPVLGDVVISDILSDEATATAAFDQNAGTGFTEYGFVVAELSINPVPQIGGTGVATIDFDPALEPLGPSIQAILMSLTAATEYAVRAYAIYDGGALTIYSENATIFTTLAPPAPLPALDGVVGYTQDFSAYVSAVTLPSGWSVVHGGTNDYDGDWGTGTGNGPRGNASVLGFQHTSSTGIAIKTLTIINNTGAELNEITVSYEGRVARSGEGRSPAYTVFVNNVAVSALTYSTTEGDNITKTASISDLAIPAGETFTIEWESTRGDGSGSSKQIGISNVVVATGSTALPPAVGAVSVDPSNVLQTEFFASSSVLADNGQSVTSRGFVYAETALNPAPELAGADVTEVNLGSGLGEFDAFIDSLTPGTRYSIRAFSTNSIGTTYSGTLVVETLGEFPLLGDLPYTQNFSEFDGTPPAGWQAVSSGGVNGFLGDWGSGTTGGFRGNELVPGVLGYQHTSTSGELIITLTLVNDTGAPIENLEIGYLGRVERSDQGRSPAWTVEVDFADVEALAYSTSNGVDEVKFALVTGLFIPEGATFSISWTSDNIGTGTGSSRQIGISEVSVAAVDGNFLSPVEIDPLSATYLGAVTVSMFTFDTDVEIRYTLDGTIPDEGSLLYTEEFVISQTTTVQARAFPTDPLSLSEPSAVTIRNYVLPIFVTELSEVKNPELGKLYLIDTEVIVSYIDGGSFRNQAYLTDGTGGIFVDDPAGNLNAPVNHAVGDGITGLVGTFTVFQEQLQFTPDPSTGVSSGILTSFDNTVPSVSVTLNELNTNFIDYRYRLVSITDIVFDVGDGVATFGNGASLLDVTDSSGNAEFYVFFSTDYIGALVPEGSVDLLAIPHSRSNGNFLSARSLADFSSGTPPSSDPLADYLGDRGLLPADLLTDTNGNGFTVIEEYLAGFGDGLGSDRIVFSIDPATGALTLTSDLEFDPEGIVIELLATADLSVPFAPVAFTVTSVDNGDGTFTRSYTEDTPPAEADNRFYQLRLREAP